MNRIVLVFLLAWMGLFRGADAQDQSRAIDIAVYVEAPLKAVWQAWTTETGVKTFLAPDAKIDPRVGGAYELYFDPKAELGQRGSEGCVILAIEPMKMLSFTLNPPPDMPEIRKQRTHVTVRFSRANERSVKVSIFHDGWGEGEQWNRAYEYFKKTWREIVLPRLVYSFAVEPIIWEDPQIPVSRK